MSTPHWELSGLYYLPSNLPGLSAYLKAGVGQLTTDVSKGRNDGGPFAREQLNSTQVSAGLGGEYRFSNDWGIRAEALFVDKDSSQLTLNVIKRFGRDYTPPPNQCPPHLRRWRHQHLRCCLRQCKELKALFEQVYFAVNSAELTPASRACCKNRQHPQTLPQRGPGNLRPTDSQGSDASQPGPLRAPRPIGSEQLKRPGRAEPLGQRLRRGTAR